MKNIITIIVVFLTVQMYSQGWTELPNFTNDGLWTVEMLDTATIIIGGNNYSLYKSTNGGDTWDQLNNTILITIYDTDFPSQNIGYAVGNNWSASGEDAMKTTDGGTTWTALNIGYYYQLLKVQFLDTLNGYILSKDSTIHKTTDGGNTWVQSFIPVSFNNSCLDMHFFDINTGVVIDSTNALIYRTTDGGLSWNTINLVNVASFYFLHFIDSIGYAVGEDNIGGSGTHIQKTTDYGMTWNLLPATNISYQCTGVYFHDELFGYLIGYHAINTTFDGGQTWIEESLPIQSARNIDFYNCLGFIVGGGGQTLRTNTCGILTEVNAGNNIYLTCGESDTINPIVTYSGPNTLSYSWSPSYGLSDTTILNPVANPTITTTYTITVSDGMVNAIDSVTVFVDPLPEQEICMVTVDSVYGKNKIIWEKALLPIEEYYIWKETFISGTYNLMDVVPYDSVGMYIDMTSEPNVQSDKYKISVLDSCGYISDMGNYHKTIHLNISPAVPTGYALTWEHYEGFSFDTYVIYRKNNNNLFDSIQSLAYSAGVFTYTDVNPPGGNIYYFIAAQKLTPCDTTLIGTKLFGEPYSQSLSNIEDNIAGNVNEISLVECKIFPNPTTGKIIVQAEGIEIIVVLNLQGKEIYNGKGKEIDLGTQPKGIYIIKVTTSKGVVVRKVVLE